MSFNSITFPNPFCFTSDSTIDLSNIQTRWGFSNEYIQFIAAQNGFDAYLFEEQRQNQLQPFLKTTILNDDEIANIRQDLKLLYGFLPSNHEEYEHSDSTANNEEFIFKKHFYTLGTDKGGNDFVEVLHGKYKGYVGLIDHEMYAGCDDLVEFAEQFELEGFFELDINEATNMLCGDYVMQFLAENFADFIQQFYFAERRKDVLVRDLLPDFDNSDPS
jgi:hypothetical protein